MSFDVDFGGRLKKVRVPASAPLQAVFEAVANAFDATADLDGSGEIAVRILRKPAANRLFVGEEPTYELAGFEIEDNGVGFTDENLMYFRRSDTTHKSSGKGVGRLLWLHVFDHAEIESVYEQGGGRFRRRFTFSKENSGVVDSETEGIPVGDEVRCGTKVRLLGPKRERVRLLDQTVDQLAAKLLEHFLLYFAVIRGQSLHVEDGQTAEVVTVGDLYREVIGDRHREEVIEIRGHKFALHHLMVKPTVNRLNSIIPYSVRSDTSSNVWNRRVMSAARRSAWVVGILASVSSMAARKEAKFG